MIKPEVNPDWYRVKYSIAALHANWATETDGDHEPPAGTLEQRQLAHRESKRLAEAALTELRAPSKGAGANLPDFLRKSILPAALVIYAGTAAHDVQAVRNQKVPAGEDELLDRLKSDASLTAKAAMAYVESHRPTARVLYNLACAHAQLGELDEAEACLRKAIGYAPDTSRKRLTERALNDPSLKPLLDEHAALVTQLRQGLERPAGPRSPVSSALATLGDRLRRGFEAAREKGRVERARARAEAEEERAAAEGESEAAAEAEAEEEQPA